MTIDDTLCKSTSYLLTLYYSLLRKSKKCFTTPPEVPPVTMNKFQSIYAVVSPQAKSWTVLPGIGETECCHA